MNNKEEGFDENDPPFYQFISHQALPPQFYSEKPSKSKTKYKMSFKIPLTIFSNITLTQSPDQSIQLQWDQKNPIQHSDNEMIPLEQGPSPLESIVQNQQKTLKTLGSEQSPYIVQKVSDAFPKKFICFYNKFQQNIFLKNDLTLVVKNITRCLKFELIKTVEMPFAFLHPKNQLQMFNSDKINLDSESIKSSQKRLSKKSRRYESQESLKLIHSKKNSIKKLEMSPFELQKSLIFNREVKQRHSQIQFFSNFESGNLQFVFKDKFRDNLFYLFLTNDINTHGFNQWFYFGVKYLGSQTKKYRFVIMNISKEFKFDQKMRLLSLYDGKWHRKTNFSVYRNKYSRYSGGNLISLDFEYQFVQGSKQSVFFSLGYPYTFTRTVKFVKQIKSKDYKNLLVTIETLGKTELTNFIPVLKIEKIKEKKLRYHPKKKTILILARQHASQTPSSFICESFVRNLLSENKQWQILLNSYKFVIIPMANPDGVIHGNSRTNIKGYDINRLWQPSKNNLAFMSAETQEMNTYLMDLLEQEHIEYTIDLHSHSRQYGSFVYCCDNSDVSRLFRYYFTKNYPECSYQKCKINLTSDKKCTFRGQMYHRLGIKNSFTIQTSFYGYIEQNQNQDKKLIPFTLKNFSNIARSILFALTQILKNQIASDQQKQLLKVIDQMDTTTKTFRKSNSFKTKQFNNSSDSDPENQYLEIKERRQIGQSVNQSPNKSGSKFYKNRSFKSSQNQDSLLHTKSLQNVSKIDQNFIQQSQTKNKRKRIFTSVGYGGSRNKLAQSPKDGDNSISKKFLTHAEKQIDFRRTLRSGFNMTKSQTGFYCFRQNCIKKQKQPEKKLSTNCIVYPTSTDLQLNSQNIRLLHDNLFKGRIKVKSIKQQQYRFLRRMGKGGLLGEQNKYINLKESYQKKDREQNSKEKQICELLSVQKIEQLRYSGSFAAKK